MEFEIRAIDPGVVQELLTRDDAGSPPRTVVDEDGGSPLRCCLTKARPGERIGLVSYAPLRRWAAETGADPGPYDEVGPIFLHLTGCPGAEADPSWPDAHRNSHRMLRAYAADGYILGGTYLAAGGEPNAVLKEAFADPAVAVVHVRAIEFGCFQFEVRPRSV